MFDSGSDLSGSGAPPKGPLQLAKRARQCLVSTEKGGRPGASASRSDISDQALPPGTSSTLPSSRHETGRIAHKTYRESRTCCPGIYNGVYASGGVSLCLACADLMTLRFLRIPAVIVFFTVLLASPTLSLAQNVAPQSPYGGATVEDIIARVNDQIISRSDYDRSMAEVDQEARQHGASTLQEISASHKDLLRNLIDQQLWLSRGKELGITGDTELVKRLDEIRKQYHLDTIEDLEKAAKDQGVSFEDFKANIRNGIVTQEVMRQEVGASIRFTPGEAERYYEQHKQDYTQPESVTLSEILISTGANGSSDPAKVAAAKTKADDIESRLHANGDFTQ